jgi:hypothetical protein
MGIIVDFRDLIGYVSVLLIFCYDFFICADINVKIADFAIRMQAVKQVY